MYSRLSARIARVGQNSVRHGECAPGEVLALEASMPARPLRYAAAIMVVAAVLPTMASAQSARNTRADADLKEIQGYRLTTAMLAQLSAVQENIYAMLKANPDLNKRYGDERSGHEAEAETLDEMAKRFDRIPEMKQAIVKSGLTPRQYMLATMALFQAGMSAALMDAPGADQSKIAPVVRANIAFLKAHKAEMDRMEARAKEIEQLSQPASGADPAKQQPDTTGPVDRRRR